MGRRIRLVGVALAAALALAACGGGEEAPTQAAPSASSPLVVDDGTLAAGEKIAAPKGDVVLTMTGDIGAANKGKKLELDLASLESLRLEAAELRHVADRDQLVLHYQPIVELVSGRITRVEALVRWDHPTKGLLPPLAFIPLAEEQGLIGPIGDWVLLQACLQARRWQDQFPDAPPLSMHVNLSGRQLEEPRLIGEVVRALETARLSPRLLTLEITESVLVTDIEAMSNRLRELKGLGVLAIDDFGTGYSSLSYLRRFPIDMLKIDKAFVDGIGRGREDAALANAIVKLSHTLQLHTVADGIEEPEQAAHLVALGCQDGQGYHFARPLDARTMTELLAKTVGDGGFYHPMTAQPVEQAAVP